MAATNQPNCRIQLVTTDHLQIVASHKTAAKCAALRSRAPRTPHRGPRAPDMPRGAAPDLRQFIARRVRRSEKTAVAVFVSPLSFILLRRQWKHTHGELEISFTSQAAYRSYSLPQRLVTIVVGNWSQPKMMHQANEQKKKKMDRAPRFVCRSR